MMQMTVLTLSLLLMALIAVAFVSSVRAAGRGEPVTGGEKLRMQLIVGLLVIGVVVSVASLWTWPHAVSAAQASMTVNVSGAQWYWEIDTETVPLGTPVVFNAHTVDVTHGFGVVDAAGRILFQTQAMPGYVNKVEYVFTEPGTYRVICLEYCGVGHHGMLTEFTAVANQE